MERSEFDLKSGFGTLFIGVVVLLISGTFGLGFPFLKFKDPQPSHEIKVIVSISFILVGVGAFFFSLMRSTNKLFINREFIYLSRLRKSESIEWDIIQSIYIKFTGKAKIKPARGLVDALVQGTLDGLGNSNEMGSIFIEISTESGVKSSTIKFTNRSVKALKEFLEFVNQLRSVKPEFTDHKKKLWNEFSWTYSF